MQEHWTNKEKKENRMQQAIVRRLKPMEEKMHRGLYLLYPSLACVIALIFKFLIKKIFVTWFCWRQHCNILICICMLTLLNTIEWKSSTKNVSKLKFFVLQSSQVFVGYHFNYFSVVSVLRSWNKIERNYQYC